MLKRSNRGSLKTSDLCLKRTCKFEQNLSRCLKARSFLLSLGWKLIGIGFKNLLPIFFTQKFQSFSTFKRRSFPNCLHRKGSHAHHEEVDRNLPLALNKLTI